MLEHYLYGVRRQEMLLFMGTAAHLDGNILRQRLGLQLLNAIAQLGQTAHHHVQTCLTHPRHRTHRQPDKKYGAAHVHQTNQHVST